jgi:hypothetical protein
MSEAPLLRLLPPTHLLHRLARLLGHLLADPFPELVCVFAQRLLVGL